MWRREIVAAGLVVKHQRRGLGLSGFAANFQEGGVLARIRGSPFAKGFRPLIGDHGEARISAAPELCYQFREWFGKVFVVADSEAIALHNDVAAKPACIVIKRGDLRTFRWRQNGSRNGGAAPRARLLPAP